MTVLFLFLSALAIAFKVLPPKNINDLYGYRTSSSMKNIENWNLANKYSTNLMLIFFLLLLLASFILELLNIEATIWLIGLLLLSLGIMLFLTEKKIKQHEDSK
jgi:uncharacterized membrane protein